MKFRSQRKWWLKHCCFIINLFLSFPVANSYLSCLQRYEFLRDSCADLQYNLTIHSCWRDWILFDKYEMEMLRLNFLSNRKWRCHIVGKRHIWLFWINLIFFSPCSPPPILCVNFHLPPQVVPKELINLSEVIKGNSPLIRPYLVISWQL